MELEGLVPDKRVRLRSVQPGTMCVPDRRVVTGFTPLDCLTVVRRELFPGKYEVVLQDLKGRAISVSVIGRNGLVWVLKNPEKVQ